MLKSKLLISILTGAITLTSAGLATVISNPSKSSEWLSQRLTTINRLVSSEEDESDQTEWFDTSVPNEANLLAVDVDDNEDETKADRDEDEDGESSEQYKADQEGMGAPDAMASASVPDEESAATATGTPMPGASGGSTTVDAMTTASIPAGESTTGSATTSSGSVTSGSTSVDVIASASKPGSTTTISTEGLLTVEEAIDKALEKIGPATFVRYEMDDDYPPVYELHFVSGNVGYEVDVLATNGTILDVDSETASLEEDREDERDDEHDSDHEDDEHDDEHEHESDEHDD